MTICITVALWIRECTIQVQQINYQRRRKKSCPHKLLAAPELFNLVKKLFLGERWSPEQIANRLKLENYPIQISYKTIYRAIYAAMFDTPEQKRSTGNRGAIRNLRHRGKGAPTKTLTVYCANIFRRALTSTS